ncbi:MAG: prepilin peptidase [Pseudomonadota bacterium]
MSVPFTFLECVFGGLLGLLGGSFLTVVTHRGPISWGLVTSPNPLPAHYSLAMPRSHCPKCQTPISPLHLIPIVGFIISKGQCANCSEPISWRYPLIEGLGVLSGLSAVMFFNTPIEMVGALVFLLALVALAVIDWETGYLPDMINFPLMGVGLCLGIGSVFITPLHSFLGAVLGYGFFYGLGAIYKKLRGHEGLGQGDAKLLGAMGAFIGPYALPAVILIGAVSALVFIAAKAVRGTEISGQTEIRFGPFLTLGGAISFLVL